MLDSTLYSEDILKDGFEQRVIPLRDDYQGKVIATLVRRLSATTSDKAVLYVHGFNDYFFQSEMAHRFNEEGFNFYALDLRKYGRSYLPHQKFNDIRNLKDYDEEILASLHIIHSEGNKKVLLMGHSTGGLTLTLFAKDHKDSDLFDGLILNSPFYEFNESWLRKKLIQAVVPLGRCFPQMLVGGGFSKEYGESIHKNYSGEWNYNLKWKPIVAPQINLGWLGAIYKAQRQLKKPFGIAVPVLVMHSAMSVTDANDPQQVHTRDAILNVNDIKNIAHNIERQKEIVAIQGGLHDLVLSPKAVREVVYKTISDWIKRYL